MTHDFENLGAFTAKLQEKRKAQELLTLIPL